MDFEDPHGDVLADILGVALLRNALYKRIEAQAPWGLHVAARPRALFYLLARGSALLEVAGEKPLALSAGDVVFLPHGTTHTLRDAKGSPTMSVCDGRPRAESGPSRFGGNGAATSIIAGFFDIAERRKPVLLERMPNIVRLTRETADPWVAATVQLVLVESASSGPASAIIMQRLADVLFVQALRSLSVMSQCTFRGLPALADPEVHRALRLMHGRVDAPWTVAELATKVGLSRSGFAARFTELVGEPPLQYLARWRIARAAELLRESEDGVVEIAGRVGYESVPSFSKAFKRWQGMSPAAFRRFSRAPTTTSAAPVTK